MASTPHNAQHGPPRDDNRDGPAGGGSGDPSTPDRLPAWQGDPYLQVVWGDAPVITGDLGPQGQGGGGAHRSHPAFTVDLGSIRDCENGMLGQARESVAGYMQLKERVRSAIDADTVWGQHAMKLVEHTSILNSYGTYTPARPDTLEADGPVQQSAEAYAKVMNPVMSEVLRQIADSIESVGQFVALLNRAGQQYAAADRSSFFPDPPPPVVPATA
ncbi:hypothetical protein GCM10009665_16230 [Kitasatospora nipponensis]|uniref:PE family protein n=1 Tax=Kitasatospora nipponensis TaxID=258049 RepID=A0ABN1VXB1_9ACTN